MDAITLTGFLLASSALGAVGYLLGKQCVAGSVPRSEHERIVAERAGLQALLSECQAQTARLQQALDEKSAQLADWQQQAATSRTQSEENAKRLTEQKAELEQMQLLMEQKFQNLSAQMLEKMGQRFNTQSEEKLGELLKPMRERLSEFSKLVADSFSEQGKEQRSLKDQIEKVVLEAGSLSKALRGDVKAQGNWGEVMLERILEQSGLHKGTDYVVQGEELKLKTEDGSRQKPDVVVKLPDGKHLIVDSKVSLTAYDRYCRAEDDAQRSVHLREFLTSVRAHVVGLAGKDYAGNAGLSSPDFVMLFMPIEGAFSLAVQQDPELHAFAWSKRIALVCPTTLFATLQTVASLWRIEKQNKNAEDIAKRGAALYEKFVGFIDDMQGIGKQLDTARSRYEGAMNKLSVGTGNLVRQAQMLKEMGVKTQKTLPKELTASDEADIMLESTGG